MACWQQLLLLLFVALVVAEEARNPSNDETTAEDRLDDTSVVHQLPTATAVLHRQKRHDIEIHRVIKRRPKLPPPPRGRKPRPPRRPGSKPRVKYGPPGGPSYKPLAHYVPQSIDDPFSSGFEASFADHHGSFGEPPAGYGPTIHPSPTFGSPPFAYGQTITSYEGSSFGKPGNYEGPSFGKHGYQGSISSSSGSSSLLSSFPKSNYDGSGSFDGGFSKATFGSGPSIFDSKVPFGDASGNFNSFNAGGKHSAGIGGYSHSFSHSGNGKQPTFADSTSINTYTTPSGKGSYYADVSSFGVDVGSKHHAQLPLETHKKDPYKTPLTSYEVPSNPKSNLFEPSGDFEASYKRTPHNGGVSSTHITSHSTIGSSEEEPYIPNLPTRYDQEQFHTPTKNNPNKPPLNTLQSINGDNDHFSSFTSYYDGASESQKVPVKSNPSGPGYAAPDTDANDGSEYSPGKRTKINRRKKKPKFPPGGPIAHNLDTDDLRDAFGSSSDFHQVAIGADEFLEFEPKKQSIKHSKPAGVTLPRAEESSPSNFVLLSSQNKGASSPGAGKAGSRGEPASNHHPASTHVSSAKSIEYDLSNYFQTGGGASGNNQGHRAASKPQDDLSILSIQKSNSKSYYAGASHGGSGFQPTRRGDMMHYRSAPSSLDYTMLDEDDDENYDDISDIGTRVRGSRKKKDLSEKPADKV